MPTYRLDNWTFNVWAGPPPGLLAQHVSTHTRAGATGVDHTKLGEWGDPFTRELTSYYASHLLALDDWQITVRPMIGLGLLRLWYAGIDFSVRYATVYKVTNLELVECQTYVRVTGSGLNIANAGVLKVSATLVPHRV